MSHHEISNHRGGGKDGEDNRNDDPLGKVVRWRRRAIVHRLERRRRIYFTKRQVI